MADTPHDAPTLQDLARALQADGRTAEALGPASQAVEGAPTDTNGLLLLSGILRDLGRFDEATAASHRALEIEPRLVPAMQELATLASEQAQIDEALIWLERSLEADPHDAASWMRLGMVHAQRGEGDAAVEAYDRALELGLRPSAGLRLRRATVLPPVCRSRDDMLTWRARWGREVTKLAAAGLTLDDPIKQRAPINFFLAYHGLGNRVLQEQIARLYLDACPDLGWVAPHCRDDARRGPEARADRRIRIGIISRYLSWHSIAKTMRGIIAHLDRQRFEVVVFQFGETDVMSRRIARLADQSIRLSGSLLQMREQIAAEALDVLFYADIGMDPVTYFLAFARLAPVQCTTFGHPDTTGIPNMDAFLSADVMEPRGAEAHYSEQLVRLGRIPTRYDRPAVPDQPGDRGALGLPEDATLYVCPQALFKLHPDFDDAVREILRRDPRGRLVLIDGLSQNWDRLLRARLAATMPDCIDRVLTLPRLGRSSFFNLLRVADVVLDSFHFGGTNTTYEAFAIGTPVVTWPGPFMRGRVTTGAYRQMGVDGPIAETHQQYVDLAVAIANDRAWRTRLGDEIRAASGNLYEDDAAVREIEAYLERAVAVAAGVPLRG